MRLETTSLRVLSKHPLLPTHMCATGCVSEMVVGLHGSGTEGICRLLELCPMKLRFLGLLPLIQAELLPQSSPISWHTERGCGGTQEGTRQEALQRTVSQQGGRR